VNAARVLAHSYGDPASWGAWAFAMTSLVGLMIFIPEALRWLLGRHLPPSPSERDRVRPFFLTTWALLVVASLGLVRWLAEIVAAP